MNANKSPAVLVLTSAAAFSLTSPEVMLCRFLRDSGYLPILICPTEGSLSQHLREQRIEVIIMPTIHRWRHIKTRLTSPWLIGSLVRLARSRSVVLIHANRLSVTPFAARAARKLCIPCISHLHGVPREAGKFARYLVHEVDALVAVSKAALQHYSARAGQLVSVIYNGMDIEEFRACAYEFDARSCLRIPDGLIVGMSGAYALKGLDIFVDAAALVMQQVKDVRFLVMGSFRSADFEAKIREEIARHRLHNSFYFPNYQKNVAPFMAASDVWAVPSRVDAAPRVVQEALALGKPVVGSRIGGIPELVEDGVCGTIIPPENSAALADAINDLLSNPEKRAAFGAAGRKRVELFSFERFSEQMKKMYNALIPNDAQHSSV